MNHNSELFEDPQETETVGHNGSTSNKSKDNLSTIKEVYGQGASLSDFARTPQDYARILTTVAFQGIGPENNRSPISAKMVSNLVGNSDITYTDNRSNDSKTLSTIQLFRNEQALNKGGRLVGSQLKELSWAVYKTDPLNLTEQLDSLCAQGLLQVSKNGNAIADVQFLQDEKLPDNIKAIPPAERSYYALRYLQARQNLMDTGMIPREVPDPIAVAAPVGSPRPGIGPQAKSQTEVSKGAAADAVGESASTSTKKGTNVPDAPPIGEAEATEKQGNSTEAKKGAEIPDPPPLEEAKTEEGKTKGKEGEHIPDAPPLEDANNRSMIKDKGLLESITDTVSSTASNALNYAIEHPGDAAKNTLVTAVSILTVGWVGNKYLVKPAASVVRGLTNAGKGFFKAVHNQEKITAKRNAAEKRSGEKDPRAQFDRFMEEVNAECTKRTQGVDNLTRGEKVGTRRAVYGEVRDKWQPKMAEGTKIIADRNKESFIDPPLTIEEKREKDNLDKKLEEQGKIEKESAEADGKHIEAEKRLKLAERVYDDLRSEPGLNTAKEYLDAVNEKIKDNTQRANDLRDPRHGVADGDQVEYNKLRSETRGLDAAKRYFEKLARTNPDLPVGDTEREGFLKTYRGDVVAREQESKAQKIAKEKLDTEIKELTRANTPGSDMHGPRAEHARANDVSNGGETMVEVSASGTLSINGGKGQFSGAFTDEYLRAKRADLEAQIKAAEGDLIKQAELKAEYHKLGTESPTRLKERLVRELKAHPDFAIGKQFKAKDLINGFGLGLAIGGAVLLDAALGDDPD